MNTTDLPEVKANSNDDSALNTSSSTCNTPSSSVLDTDTSFSNDSGYNRACEFEAELSHIHNKMIVKFSFFVYFFKIYFLNRFV